MMKKSVFFIVAMMSALLLAACGSEEEESLTLQDENWEDVNLEEKDQPTVLFHFTGVD